MTAQSISEGTVLWEPSDEIKKQATITNYISGTILRIPDTMRAILTCIPEFGGTVTGLKLLPAEVVSFSAAPTPPSIAWE